MIRKPIILLAVLAVCGAVAQNSKTPNLAPTPAQLKATTERGRMLAEYDFAGWHSTDAVEALKPDHAAAPMYIARKVDGKWEVAFGRLSGDRFLVVYLAAEGANPEEFKARKIDPPTEDHGFYFQAAKALQTTSNDFGRPQRPYNQYVLPTGDGRLYVYFLPAQTAEGVYPLGGDVRYTVTLDGGTIAERRQMHTAIIEKKNSPQPGQQVAGGYHTHALNNDVEDSDVFHVLTRLPPLPEIVGTPDKHVYEIATDGTITREK